MYELNDTLKKGGNAKIHKVREDILTVHKASCDEGVPR